MNVKDEYREETNLDVYADYCCERPAGSYADEYVRWLGDGRHRKNLILTEDVGRLLQNRC